MYANFMLALGVVTVLVPKGLAYNPDCVWCTRNLDNKVGQIENKQYIEEQRLAAITKTFSNELTTLATDSKTIKSTVSRLCDDSVNLTSRMRSLQGLDQNVGNLRKQVYSVQEETSGHLHELQNKVVASSNNLDKYKASQTQLISLLSKQMNDNNGMLSRLNGSLTAQETRLANMEARMAKLKGTDGSPASVESIQGQVAEMTEILNSLREQYDQQVPSLRNSIEDLRKELRMKEFYPG